VTKREGDCNHPVRPMSVKSYAREEKGEEEWMCKVCMPVEMEEEEEDEKSPWHSWHPQPAAGEARAGEEVPPPPTQPEEEGREVRNRRPARGPTAEELRVHRLTHWPFRSWCPDCVAGRAKDWGHPQREKKEREVPTVHLDYCFPRDHEGGDSVATIVGKDDLSKMSISHVVPRKGADHEWVVKQLVRDLQRMGHHGRLVLHSDQEPALVDLLSEVAKMRGE
jgi:hypothetical protein